MKVRMKIGRYAGEIKEVPYSVGARMIQQGFADEVRDGEEEFIAPVETATAEPPEKAMKPKAKRRRVKKK